MVGQLRAGGGIKTPYEQKISKGKINEKNMKKVRVRGWGTQVRPKSS